MRVTIVGVKQSDYKGKDGKPKVGFNYLGIKQFTDYEQENNQCEGNDVIREFSNKDFGLHPGDIVEFMYEPGYEGRATLVDVKMIKIADAPFNDGDKKSTK